MSESSNEGFTMADKVEHDSAELPQAETFRCWMKLHNFAQGKLVIEEGYERSGPKNKEEWHARLTVEGNVYEGYALTKIGAKNLAAKRALVGLEIDWRNSE